MALRRVTHVVKSAAALVRPVSYKLTPVAARTGTASGSGAASACDWERFSARLATTAPTVEEEERESDDVLDLARRPSVLSSTMTKVTGTAMALAAGLPVTMALSDAASPTALAAAAEVAAVNPLLASFLSVFPPLCFGFLQLSPMKTVNEIKQKQSVGELSPLPFVSLATNCVVWDCYGFLNNDMTVLLPNLTGAAFGFYYTYQYVKHAKSSLTTYLLGSATIMGSALAMAVMLDAPTAAHYIGLTGCTLAVILMASPLATLKTVIDTKNTSAMPFMTSLATLFNAASWSGYGYLVANDPMIWGPNSLGLVAALVQMGLFAKYGIHSSSPSPKTKPPV